MLQVGDDVACVGMLQVADRDRRWSVTMLLVLACCGQTLVRDDVAGVGMLRTDAGQ